MGARDELGIDLARAQKADGFRTVSVQVVDVRQDGTVNVDWGGSLLTGVACADAYRVRRVGDWVAMRVGQRPVVLWRPGPDPGADGEAATRALAEDAALDVQVVRAATWGTSPPTGSGWQQATTPWIRKTSGGKVELYMQLGSMTVSSPEAPPDRPPNTVKTTAVVTGSWRGGRRIDSFYAAQGDPGGSGGAMRGAFIYFDLPGKVAGKTVASMQLTVWRVKGFGPSTKVPIHFYLHGYTDPPAGQLNLGDGPEDLMRLSDGGKATVTLPASWSAALAAGTAGGVAVYGSSRSDYCELNGGDLTITFSA